MKKFLKSVSFAVLIGLSFDTMSFDAPDYYERKCSSCHTIGGGDDVGPDLKGVTELRNEKWLIEFIRDSEKVINSGDPIANELFAKFRNKKMPAQELSDDEIKALLAFIKTGKGTGAVSYRPATAGNPYDIEMGQALFIGKQTLEKGGPSCLSCHGAGENLPYLGGGTLGPDLVMTSYAGYLDKGLNKVLSKISFPSMAQIYANAPLTEQENYYIRAFLHSEYTKFEQNNEKKHGQGSSQNKFLLLGMVSASVGLLVMDGIWRRRRKKTKRPY